MSKIKLFIKESKVNGEIRHWLEDESGQEVDLTPKVCAECEEGMWSGHVLEDGETYCSPCFKEKYSDKEREEMYFKGEQYYTEWRESDLDPDIYEVIDTRK